MLLTILLSACGKQEPLDSSVVDSSSSVIMQTSVHTNPTPSLTTTSHTSGHADEQTIKELVRKTKPKKIMPIHTEMAEWFEENF